MLKKDELAAALEGKGCLGRSADDEPVFVLVGRDAFAGECVRYWADRVEMIAVSRAGLTGKLKEKIAEARRLAMAMDAWHTRKLPD